MSFPYVSPKSQHFPIDVRFSNPFTTTPGLLGYNAVLVGAGFAVFAKTFLMATLGTLIFGSLSALLAAGLSTVDWVIGQPE